MGGDWLVMTEEEKYAEWSEYVTTDLIPGVLGPPETDYSEYCDWMNKWERGLMGNG